MISNSMTAIQSICLKECFEIKEHCQLTTFSLQKQTNFADNQKLELLSQIQEQKSLCFNFTFKKRLSFWGSQFLTTLQFNWLQEVTLTKHCRQTN